MNKNLTCNQVSALINFYLEGKLNERLHEYVDNHLNKCPHCRKKIEELKKILLKYNSISKKKERQQATLDSDTLAKISAYADNELDSKDNIKIKRMTISNPTARSELENIYKFKKAIHSAYEKTKNSTKFDCSKSIISTIQDDYEYGTTYFYKLAVLFVLLIVSIICGFIYLNFI